MAKLDAWLLRDIKVAYHLMLCLVNLSVDTEAQHQIGRCKLDLFLELAHPLVRTSSIA